VVGFNHHFSTSWAQPAFEHNLATLNHPTLQTKHWATTQKMATHNHPWDSHLTKHILRSSLIHACWPGPPNAQRRVVLLLASDALVHACPTSSHLGGNNYCQIIISHSKSIVLIIHIYGLCPNPNLHKFNRSLILLLIYNICH
jgi:hypothetical protein